jgi:LemA protein
MIALGAILGIIVLLGLFFMGKYNGFIKLHQKVKNCWSQIDVQLQKRLDLIPNLVEVVKGYAKHEKETFEDVVKARNTYINASSVEDKIAAEGGLGAIMNKLMMLTENYPELKANTNFLDLQGQLKDIEGKIGFARQFYNDTTSDYNEAIRLFPGNIVAGIFNFKEEPLFHTIEAARTAPSIKF